MAKIKNMSIALDYPTQEKLKEVATRKNISVSSLIRDTLEKYLLADKDAVKLVMQIPKDVISDKQKLEEWLQKKFQALLNHFGS